MTKLERVGPGLLIGIPTLGRPVSLEWSFSFKAMNPPINFNTNFSIVKGKEVAVARNLIVQQAKEQNAKYLFFLGDDVIVPPHGLRQLIYRLENDEGIDVVGGVYCSKCEPAAPLVFREFGQGSYWNWKIGEFFKVAALGMDCTLIRMSLFDKLSEPFFKTVDTDGYLDGFMKAEMWTEDLFFFNKIENEALRAVFCDASVICEHVDVYNNKTYKLPLDSLPMRQRLVKKDKKRLIIDADARRDDSEEYEDIYFGQEEWCDYRGSIHSLPFESKEFDTVIVFGPLNEECVRVCKEKSGVQAAIFP